MADLGNIEGRLQLVVGISDGVVADVSIGSTRAVGACSILHGRSVVEALRAIPAVFSICGTAQVHAGMAACEEALGQPLSGAQQAARNLLLMAETAREHCWRVALDWPKLVGQPPDVKTLGALRGALGGITSGLFPDHQWIRPGGGRLRVDGQGLDGALGSFSQVLGQSFLAGWESVTDVDTLRDWAEGGDTPAADLVRQVLSLGLAGFGGGSVGLMDPPDLAAIEAALAGDSDGSFVLRPHLEGVVHETGPLARMRAHPVVLPVLEQFGNGLLARLVARLVELGEISLDMRRALPHLSDHEGDGFDCGGSGVGVAAVEAARGMLVHRVELEKGSVRRYQILAPTEWNFHPEGPLVEGLRGSAGQGIEEAAAMLITALDPCVAFDLVVEESDHA